MFPKTIWERERGMVAGRIVVERAGGKSTVTKCFSKYPLKFIIPNKVAPSKTDAVWIYSLTYGGGIVSVVFRIQALVVSQVYKSLGSKCSQQFLKATVGVDALLAVIPDPVTCFSTARYRQKQVFRVLSNSSLVLVDWFTSGRHENGERWNFDIYNSTNNIILGDDQPVFLDTVLVEKGSITTISERMLDYQVIAMVVLLGPKLKQIQCRVQENVKKMMSEELNMHFTCLSGHAKSNGHCFSKPSLVASCSRFGPEDIGVVVRVAATTTESVYKFLQSQLACLETLIGVLPYRGTC
ncbi:hypothetical protein Tsubulata_009970 [Turnera subulata]|uniref:Urease accessory protein D n=1 Tax=Turnera subulata TaxID=218843 RepID=A0A9Q0GA03_9ROSI|nr:hypothetical protein Tsubulata_009970 [Turnera subulata]